MLDLLDGESVAIQGSGARPYVLKNVGGVYSCTCPAWRNQSIGIERRTCSIQSAVTVSGCKSGSGKYR